MDEIRIASWAELNDALYQGSWRADLVRFRSPLAFRGFPDASVPLFTGLHRFAADAERLEPRLLANFRKYAHHDAVRGESVWSWLALAQHHGLPTRLIDWTYSPWVGAHFATAGLDDRWAETMGSRAGSAGTMPRATFRCAAARRRAYDANVDCRERV